MFSCGDPEQRLSCQQVVAKIGLLFTTLIAAE